MSTVTLEETQTQLPKLIEQLRPGEEIVITREERPLARLVGEPKLERTVRRLGTMKGTVLHMAPNFDAPLADYKECMALS